MASNGVLSRTPSALLQFLMAATGTSTIFERKLTNNFSTYVALTYNISSDAIENKEREKEKKRKGKKANREKRKAARTSEYHI